MAYFAKNKGVKTIVESGSESGVGSNDTLLIEIGKEHCFTALFDKKANSITAVQMMTFNEAEAEEHLPGIIQRLAGHHFHSVVVCSAFPQALLFPTKYFQKDYTALNTVYDLPAQAYFYDSIEEWQMVNAYALPEPIYDIITDSFPDARFMHCYTPAIKIYNGFVADQQLSVHFAGNFFRVVLKKEMAIHLVQTWRYQSPLDVVYYLLRICQEFGLEQQQVFLILSGLIEKDSALFTEMQQYFTNIHFAQQPEISLPQSQHPHYYFTAVYNLAACVL
jgi:hypothetical protein